MGCPPSLSLPHASCRAWAALSLSPSLSNPRRSAPSAPLTLHTPIPPPPPHAQVHYVNDAERGVVWEEVRAVHDVRSLPLPRAAPPPGRHAPCSPPPPNPPSTPPPS